MAISFKDAELQLVYVDRDPQETFTFYVRSIDYGESNSVIDTTTFLDDTENNRLGWADNTLGLTKKTLTFAGYMLNSDEFNLSIPQIGDRVETVLYIPPTQTLFQQVCIVRSVQNDLRVNDAYSFSITLEADVDEYY